MALQDLLHIRSTFASFECVRPSISQRIVRIHIFDSCRIVFRCNSNTTNQMHSDIAIVFAERNIIELNETILFYYNFWPTKIAVVCVGVSGQITM